MAVQTLSINLLPHDYASVEKAQNKRSKIVKITVAVLALMILITVLVFGFGIFRKTQQQQANQDLITAQQRVTALKDKEVSLSTIHQRILAIDNIEKQSAPSKEAFNLLLGLIPDSTKILDFTADNRGSVTLLGEIPDTSAMQTLFDNLIDPQKNQQKIAKIQIDSLSLLKTGGYRISLTAIIH